MALFNNTEAGFTLLELIVTLTILTVIIVLAFGAFRLGIKAWETGDERVEFFYGMKYLVDLMEKEISSIRPYFLKDSENEDEKLFFEGKPNFISFISSIKNNSAGIVRKVSFSLEGDEKQLVMTEEFIQSYQPFSKTNERKVRYIKLSKDVRDLKFRYYKLKEGVNLNIESSGEWVADFSSKKKDLNNKTLPRAVEVTMVIQAQKEGVNKAVETFYLPPFIILLNAGMEFRYVKVE